MMRKYIYNILTILVLTSGFSACSDFLDVEPKDRLTADVLLSSDGGINAYMAGLYYMLPMEDFRYDFTKNGTGAYGINRVDGGKTNMMSSPEAVHSEWGDHAGQAERFNNWEDIYKNIRKYNEMKDNIPLMKPSNTATLTTLKGEYFFFMAYNYFALVKRYGGVPIITEVQQFSGDYDAVKVPRSKEVDTWKFILSQCDSAIALLPNTTTQERANKWTAYTLKSRAALHAASTGKFWNRNGAALTGPAVTQGLVGGFTASDIQFFYQECINACAEVIKSGKFSLYGGSPASLTEAATNYGKVLNAGAGISEVIFLRHYAYPGVAHNMGKWHEPNQLAVEYGGRCCPTLEMVESYAKIDPVSRTGNYNVKLETTTDGDEDYTVGYSFNNNHNYIRYDNMTDIFANRDPRLYASVILPNTSWGGKNIIIQGGILKQDGSAIWQANDKYTFNGVDYYGKGNSSEGEFSGWVSNRANGTRTGFLLKKYLTGTNDQVWDQVVTPFTELRYADILLNYAEAVAESGLSNAPGIITAQEALNMIRKRAGFLDIVPLTTEDVQYERKAEFGLEYNQTWEYTRRREYHTFFNNTYHRQGLVPMADFTTGSLKYIFVRANIEPGNNAKNFEPKIYYRPIPGIGGNSLVQNPNY
ncbi:glycan metabolism protein RagB [Bacteroidia bacterium]|nr:glycan metabolism protein RagB [Bacteroidia bacterium]